MLNLKGEQHQTSMSLCFSRELTSAWNHIVQQCPVRPEPNQDNFEIRPIVTTGATCINLSLYFVQLLYGPSRVWQLQCPSQVSLKLIKQLSLHITESVDTGRRERV